MDEKQLAQQIFSPRGQNIACSVVIAVFLSGLYALIYPLLTGPQHYFIGLIFILIIITAFISAIKG